MRAVAAALLLAVPALCAAQSEAPVAKPEIKVGDRWIYHHWDAAGQKLVKSYELRVSLADRERDVIHTVVKRQDGSESDAMWTTDWNATISVLGEGVITPHTGFFRFPLKVGDSYRTSFEIALPQRGAVRIRRDYTVKVAGWENVVVPAGEFRALKVEALGTWQRLDRDAKGSLRTIFWYSPQAKRWLKVDFEVSGPRGLINHSVEELVLFNVQ